MSVFWSALGGGLLARAATNRDIVELVGAQTLPVAFEVHRTIAIEAPLTRVFEFWADPRNFPQFMSHVQEVRPLDGSRYHWMLAGPGGVSVEWDAEVTAFVPNERIEWRSTPDCGLEQWGSVQFESTGEFGTQVAVRLSYVPPGGPLGHAVSRLLGADPGSEMDADLMRLKSVIESTIRVPDASQEHRHGDE
jgi:uncharacterized membrane protein